ncbi:MAG: hydrogenase maturation protease [Candidatus Pacebacteria bacterium]|nr:hydrogenase maturation protease [Candidatus Paceibacterota bacterium]
MSSIKKPETDKNAPLGDVLVIGYGNPGRLDDGLGPALAAALEKETLDGVTVDSNYQLTVEDALPISQHKVVIFADADVAGPEPFYFKAVKPGKHVTFSSHSISPRSVLGLAEELFEKVPAAYVLGIRGYEFNEFEERLSTGAQNNLQHALAFVTNALKNRTFTEVREQNAPAETNNS